MLFELAILKRDLAVKSAKTLDPNDIERCCVSERADAHFAKTAVEPSKTFS
jgi:hypothetical protein